MIVVDASVVVKWFVAETWRQEARQLLLEEDVLVAPDILATEVANAMWFKVRGGELLSVDAQNAIRAVVGSPRVDLRPSPPLAPRALELVGDIDHPVYDCVYLALAERDDAVLVTADARLRAAVQQHQLGARVRLLGEP